MSGPCLGLLDDARGVDRARHPHALREADGPDRRDRERLLLLVDPEELAGHRGRLGVVGADPEARLDGLAVLDDAAACEPAAHPVPERAALPEHVVELLELAARELVHARARGIEVLLLRPDLAEELRDPLLER